MTVEQITDHAAAAVARMPSQHRDKTRTSAFVSALAAPAQDTETALWALLTERSVDVAVGAQLDRLGVVVGEPRNGETDDDVYRRRIRARISANESRGTAADIIRVARALVYDDAAQIVITPGYPAAYSVEIAGVAVDEEVAAVAAPMLRDATSAGVRVILEYSPVAPEEAFTFDGGEGLGFLEANTESLALDGVNDYAAITDAAQTGLDVTGELTLEAWIYMTSLPGAIDVWEVAGKWGGSGSRSYRLALFLGGDSLGAIGFQLSEDGSAIAEASASPVGLDVDTWYHLAVTYDPAAGGTLQDKVTIYIDGVDTAFTDLNNPTAIFNGGADFRIGHGSTSDYFEGLVDEVRVWNVVREAADIAANMDVQLEGDEPGLVGYWPLDGDFTDATANGNDLTSSGSPVFSGDVPFVDYTGADGGAFSGAIGGA